MLGGRRLQPLALDGAHAAVPAQDRIDVARRAQRLGALVPLHRVPESVVRGGAHDILAFEVRARLALVDDARVVGAVVLVVELDDVIARFAGRSGGAVDTKLVGEREDQRA